MRTLSLSAHRFWWSPPPATLKSHYLPTAHCSTIFMAITQLLIDLLCRVYIVGHAPRKLRAREMGCPLQHSNLEFELSMFSDQLNAMSGIHR